MFDLARDLAGLPDDALVPVRWLRERLADAGDRDDRLADLTVEEVAEELGRAPSTIRGWCGAERFLGAYRLRGREWRVPRESVRRMLDQERDGGPTEERDPETVDLGTWRREVAGGNG